MTSYVQKLRLPVSIAQPRQAALEGYMLLEPNAEAGARTQTVLELLNLDRTVVPFIAKADSAVVLLTRANVEWVVIGPHVDPDRVVPPDMTATREQRVEIRFEDGTSFDGVVAWDASRAPRLSDFLNASAPFYAVKARSGFVIVNKHRVRDTLLAEATPRPLDVEGDVLKAESTP